MRENPYQESGKSAEDVPFAGENFVRHTGESKDFAQAQVFAWDAMDKGVDVHFHAEPTKAAVLRKSYKTKKSQHSEDLKKSVIDKYGGQEHLKAPPKELLIAQTENYVEYSRTGQVIKGQEKAKIKSRYEEDVLLGNHTSVWGSYWEAGQWGYACCKSTVKASYCIRQTATDDTEEESSLRRSSLVPEIIKTRHKSSESATRRRDSSSSSSSSSEDEDAGKTLVEIHQQKRKKMSKKEKKKLKKEKKREKREEAKKKEQEIEKAVQAEQERIRQVNKEMSTDERKRKYNSMHATSTPTQAELEAFKRTRVNTADPMAQFLSKN